MRNRPDGAVGEARPRRMPARKKAMAVVSLTLLTCAWSVASPGGNLAAASSEGRPSQPEIPAVPTTAFQVPASIQLPGDVTLPSDVDLPSGVDAHGGSEPTASSLSATGIPTSAVLSYQRAARVLNAADSACGLDWALIAAIGRVESDHGRFGGSVLGADGISRPAIVGIALDGTNNTAAISDTDDGLLDGDARWDRAVGPMQFIPGTWELVGVDGDGDGRKNPQDIDDAALATGVYLCAGDGDLTDAADERAAVLRYNHSTEYADLVVLIARSYRDNDYTVVSDDHTPATVPTTRDGDAAGSDDEPDAKPRKPQDHSGTSGGAENDGDHDAGDGGSGGKGGRGGGDEGTGNGGNDPKPPPDPDRPVDKPSDEVEEPADEPADEVEEPVEEAPVDEVEEPADEPAAEVEEPVEEAPVDEPADEPTDGEEEQPVEEPADGEEEQPADEPTAQPTGEPTVDSLIEAILHCEEALGTSVTPQTLAECTAAYIEDDPEADDQPTDQPTGEPTVDSLIEAISHCQEALGTSVTPQTLAECTAAYLEDDAEADDQPTDQPTDESAVDPLVEAIMHCEEALGATVTPQTLAECTIAYISDGPEAADEVIAVILNPPDPLG